MVDAMMYNQIPSLTATSIPLGPCSSIVDLLNANALVFGIRVHAHEIVIKLHLDLLFLSVIVQDGLETVVCVNQSRHMHP